MGAPRKIRGKCKTESAFTLVARDTLHKNPKCLINSSQEKQNFPKKKNGYFSLNIGQLEFLHFMLLYVLGYSAPHHEG